MTSKCQPDNLSCDLIKETDQFWLHKKLYTQFYRQFKGFSRIIGLYLVFTYAMTLELNPEENGTSTSNTECLSVRTR